MKHILNILTALAAAFCAWTSANAGTPATNSNGESPAAATGLTEAIVPDTAYPADSKEANAMPFVIPELKSWTAGKGLFIPAETMRIAVPSADAELLRIARMLASDWRTMFGTYPEVISGKGGKGDIIIEIKTDRKLDKLSGGSDESYSIGITDRIRLYAPTAKGIFWGTQTLLQIADRSTLNAPLCLADSLPANACPAPQAVHHDPQPAPAPLPRHHVGQPLPDPQPGQRCPHLHPAPYPASIPVSLPCGEIRDWPDYSLRGFMMDCGRKYIPMRYLRQLSRIMAYYKMNTLQIHLNDNGFKQYFGGDWDRTYAAFRLECDTYPGLTARDGYYTKAEFIDFQEQSADIFVEIIPEIDVPAHSLALTRYKPEIGSKEYGMDHLDLFNPETYTFVDGLFKEYLEGDEPVFRGPKVHIGTDEYSNKDPEVVEKFRYFTDRYIRMVESYGKQAVVWGALTHAAGKTPVKSENVIMNAWYNGYADPVKMAADGYKLISIPDGLVYIVPAAGYYYDYLNEEYLYDNWTPAHVGNAVFAERDTAILGGMFAVWNDHAGNGISVKDIHHRLFPAMQTLSVKMWTGAETALTYAQFDSTRNYVREAPGINFAGRIIPGRRYTVAIADSHHPGAHHPANHHPAGQHPAEHHPANQHPANQHPAEHLPANHHPADICPADSTLPMHHPGAHTRTGHMPDDQHRIDILQSGLPTEANCHTDTTFAGKCHLCPSSDYDNQLIYRNGYVLALPEVRPGSILPYPEIGYDYTVSFTIAGADEAPGTELFRSEDAVFYLSDPISGMMGFARDGYLNTFRYSIQDGDRLEVTVKGDNRSTTLIINGRVIDRLETEKRWYNEGESVMYYVPTLVFPLHQAGNFRSRITDLRVMNHL